MNDKKSIAEKFSAYHRQLSQILEYSFKVPTARVARAEKAKLKLTTEAKAQARARFGLQPAPRSQWEERTPATDSNGNRYFILTKPASRGATPPPRPYRIVVGQTTPEFLSMNSWFRSIQFKTRAALLNAPSLRPATVQEIAYLSQKS